MSKIVRWVGFASVLWVITFATLTFVRFRFLATPENGYDPQTQALIQAQADLLNAGGDVIGFLAPVAQFGLIIMVLIYAAERLRLSPLIDSQSRKVDGFNVQAVIAIIVVGTFALSSLTGLGSSHVSDLKDIVLVVVGFYFGTRRREGDANADAVTAGAVAGAAAATAFGNATTTSPPPPPPGATNPESFTTPLSGA